MSEPNNEPQTGKRGLPAAAGDSAKTAKRPYLGPEPELRDVCPKSHGPCEGHFCYHCFPSQKPEPKGYRFRVKNADSDKYADQIIAADRHYVACWFGKKPGPWVVDDNFEQHLERLLAAPADERQWTTVMLEERPIGLKLDIDEQAKKVQTDAGGQRPRPSSNHVVRELAEGWFRELVTGVNALLRKRNKGMAPLAEQDFLVVADLHKPGGVVSMHVHSDYLRFRTPSDLKVFVTELKEALAASAPRLSEAVDLNVYSHRQLFKLPFQNKPGRRSMLPLAGVGAQLSERDALVLGLAHKPDDHWPAEARVMPADVPVRGPKQAPRDRSGPCATYRQDRGLDAPSAGKRWFCQQVVTKFLRQQRHHCDVNFKLVKKEANRMYVEYDKNSAGSRQHPCPAYDGRTHDRNNASISVGNEFMHVSVFCFAAGCQKQGAVVFEIRETKEDQGNKRRYVESEEAESENKEDDDSDDELEAERTDVDYQARLDRLLAKLTFLVRPVEPSYIGEDLPQGCLEEACRERYPAFEQAVELFLTYWRGEAGAKRKFPPLEEGDEKEDEPSVMERSWVAIFAARYKAARRDLLGRLTLFMNDYLCHIVGMNKEAIAMFWGEGDEKEWILKPVNEFRREGGDLQIELPPLLIVPKKKAPRKPRGSVEAGRGVTSTFRGAWLLNPNRRTARKMDFYTCASDEARCNKRYNEYRTEKLNLFTGFRVSRRQVNTYMQERGLDAAAMDELAAPFRDYMHDILAGGVTQMYLYLQKWLHCLLRQGQKPEQACVFISEQGAGKSTLVELMKRVIGEQYVFVSSQPDELVGKHNLHLAFKVLVVSEEAVHSTNKVGSNVMKDRITSKKLNVNPKFLPLFTISNPSGNFYNSNHEETILVEKGCRRNIFYPVSNQFADRQRTAETQAYFARLHALPDEVLAWQLLFSQDPRVDSVDLRRDAQYDTEVFWRSAYCSAPLYVQFIYETVLGHQNPQFKEGGPAHWNVQDWHDNYNSWCRRNRHGQYTAKNIVTFEKGLEYYLRWDAQAKKMQAAVSPQEQLKYVKERITGVYSTTYA